MTKKTQQDFIGRVFKVYVNGVSVTVLFDDVLNVKPRKHKDSMVVGKLVGELPSWAEGNNIFFMFNNDETLIMIVMKVRKSGGAAASQEKMESYVVNKSDYDEVFGKECERIKLLHDI